MKKVKIAVFSHDVEVSYNQGKELIDILKLGNIISESRSGNYRKIETDVAFITMHTCHNADSFRGQKYHKLYVHSDISIGNYTILKRGLMNYGNREIEYPYIFD